MSVYRQRTLRPLVPTATTPFVTHFIPASTPRQATLATFDRDWPSIQCDHPPVPGPNCPGTYIEQVDLRHPANSTDNFLIDPNLKPIRSREFTLGLDHELSRTISVGVRYSRKRFDRTIEDTGVQVPGVGEVFRITNPGEGIGENVLRDFAGCTKCPSASSASAAACRSPRTSNATFNLPDQYQARRQVRLAVRWTF